MTRKIEFIRTHERYGDFRDAIEVADDATVEQIAAEEDARFVAWVKFLDNPPPPPPPPDEEVSDGG